MGLEGRSVRRIAGMVKTRFRELRLGKVRDPRNRRGRRWKLEGLLSAVLISLMAGCKNLAQAEALTDEMSKAMRRLLRLRRRVPDTTMRDVLDDLDYNELRPTMHGQIKSAWRRKALDSEEFPFGIVAMDGKETAIDDWDGVNASRHIVGENRKFIGLTKTITSCLISAEAKPCIDMLSIPSGDNEMSMFKSALDELVRVYGAGKLFKLLTYDAGACSAKNAQDVKDQALEYFFALKKPQRRLYEEAVAALGDLLPYDSVAETVDQDGKGTVTRRLYRLDCEPREGPWSHLKAMFRVESERRDERGRVMNRESRYFITSLRGEALSNKQWLLLVRRHWAVENSCHKTWDVAFKEDDRPWIWSDAKATLAVMALRRIAYNIEALFRTVTQRSNSKRQMPWADLMRWIYNALISATDEHIDELRQRKAVLG